MTITESPIIPTVTQPAMFDILLLVLVPRIFVSLPIFIIATRSGTAIIPFITAAYIRALIGSMSAKFTQSPTTVDAAIIR